MLDLNEISKEKRRLMYDDNIISCIAGHESKLARLAEERTLLSDKLKSNDSEMNHLLTILNNIENDAQVVNFIVHNRPVIR
jgi:hypothetical protein